MSPKQFVPYPFYLLVHWWFRVISPWVLASLFFHLYLNFSSPPPLSLYYFPQYAAFNCPFLLSLYPFFHTSPIIHHSHLHSSTHPPFSACIHTFIHSPNIVYLPPLCIRLFTQPPLILYLFTRLYSTHLYMHPSTHHLTYLFKILNCFFI